MRLAAHRARRRPTDLAEAHPRPSRRGQKDRSGAGLRRRTALAVLVLCTLVTAACSSSDSDAAPTATVAPAPPTDAPTTTEATTTTTTAAPTPEEEVEAAYLEITDTYFRRALTPEPDDPSIEMNHTGESRTVIVEELRELKDGGLKARFPDGEPPVPQILSIEVQGADTASIRLCLVDDTQVVEADSGKVVNDDVSSRLIDTSLSRPDEDWMVAGIDVLERWKDGEGCDR